MSDLFNKRMLIIMGIILGAFVLLMIIISIISSRGPISFDRILVRLETAAREYYEDNLEEIGLEKGASMVITTTRLDEDYMRPLHTMVEEGVSCHGEVHVYRLADEVGFFPLLDCGADFRSKTLADVILENEEVVEKGSGLYEMNDEYVFRGELVDNYVEFADNLWRILSIDEDNRIRIIDMERPWRVNWDDRLNTETWRRDGVNNFLDFDTQHSNMKYYLDRVIEQQHYLGSSDLQKLVYVDLCIGDRETDETDMTGKVECREVAEDSVAGLLAIYEFLRISLEEECKHTGSVACENYNFLAKEGGSTWTITPIADTTDRVYYITPERVASSPASRRRPIRPVFTLNENILFTRGEGTEENPYVVE